MSVEILRNFLFWCVVINYGLLIIGFLIITLAHDSLYRLYSRWFCLSVEQFDGINYIWIVFYKIGILLFNLVPYIALRLAG